MGKRNIIQRAVSKMCAKGYFDFLPDESYLKLDFWGRMGKRLNLKNPQTFNEKLQWLKLHDRKEIYTTMVDKYEAKKYVAERIGEEYIIPTLGVWNTFDEIDFDKLPNQFVLKCTHDSGGLVICKDKSKLDLENARKKIEKSLKTNYYLHSREWPYKNVQPRIIAEEFMVEKSGYDLKDYKFFCFGGQAKCFKVDFDRFIDHHANYYDKENRLLTFGEVICPPNPDKIIDFPENLEEMKIVAEKISQDHPFLRADFYDVNGKVYFGELTFYPASGFGKFTDEKWDFQMGNWLRLPKSIGGGYLIITADVMVVYNKLETRSKCNKALTDYKIYCFDGKPTSILVCTGRETGKPAYHYFDLDWQYEKFWVESVNLPDDFTLPCPQNMDKILKLSQVLSEKIPHVRTDFYEINGQIYFGELTFFTSSGFDNTITEEADLYFGYQLKLPK